MGEIVRVEVKSLVRAPQSVKNFKARTKALLEAGVIDTFIDKIFNEDILHRLTEIKDIETIETDDFGVERVTYTIEVNPAEELAQSLEEDTLLSERQAQAIAYDSLGLSREEIADVLNIERSTVDEHFRRARNKLEKAKTTSEALEDVFGDN